MVAPASAIVKPIGSPAWYQPKIAPGNLPNRAPITPRAIVVANRRTRAVIPTIRPKMIQGINPIGVFRP